MNILAIDTSLARVQVGVSVQGGRDACASFRHERDALSRLTPLIRDTLAEAGLRPRDIGCVACITGPGSFTGLRVGVAAAKAFADAISACVLSLSTLHVLALSAGSQADVTASLIEAVPGELYYGIYTRGASGLTELAPEGVLPAEEARTLIERCAAGHSLTLTGPAAGGLKISGAANSLVLESADINLILKAARLACDAGHTTDPVSLQPRYLRESQAEIRAKLLEK